MRAMIFAAGLGTRLKPLTDNMPKALVPLGGKPLLQWQVEQLRDAGIRDIVVNVHHFPEQIIDTIRANAGWGVNISVSDERDELLETGGGLRKARLDGLLGSDEPVLACNVDILSTIDIRALVAEYERLCSDTETVQGLLVVSERQTQRYLCFDEKGRLCGWTNLSTGELKGMDGHRLAFSGMQILLPEVLKRMAEVQEKKFSLISFYLETMQELSYCAYVPSDYLMMDVGKIGQMADAEVFAGLIRLVQEARS